MGENLLKFKMRDNPLLTVKHKKYCKTIFLGKIQKYLGKLSYITLYFVKLH